METIRWISLSVLMTGIVLLIGRNELPAFKNVVTEKCVQIFHDQGEKSFSNSLRELLSSYGAGVARLENIESYVDGDMEKCQVNFYIGSRYDNKVPRPFLDDYFTTRQKVIWIGYNIWQGSRLLEEKMGLRFLATRPLFRDILYKGQIFAKHGGSDQVELVATDLHKFESLAEIRHSRTREVIPYIVRSGNKFYIADNPFHDQKDVSFVFANVISEILGLQHFPRPQYGIR